MACFQPPTCVPRARAPIDIQSLPSGEGGFLLSILFVLVMYIKLLKAVMMEKTANILDELLLA